MERRRLQPPAEPELVAPDPQQGRGRPSLYDPKFIKMAGAHCKLGATTADLAEMFSVSTVTIETWMATHPEFGSAVQQNKAAWDDRVERSLAQRAIGYTADVEEVKVTKEGGLVRYTVRKHFPPDTTACIFWLKNRRREQWRDVQDHNHSGKLDVNNLTADQLLDQIRAEAAELGIVPPQPPNRRTPPNKTQH